MPTISERIHTASKRYTCDYCHGMIVFGDKYCRLFGMAYEDEKPYELIECSDCHRKRKIIEEKKRE